MKYPRKVRIRHEKATLSEMLCNLIDLPADVLGGGMMLEMRGRNEMLLCGCREILEYSDTRIRILQGKCEVLILGRRLKMSSYSEGRIIVCGELDALDFCGGDCVAKEGKKDED
ncbi:MAG: YabP/YqfC family sporulation protein [Clostridia bacterium]|nr:YabP/YqfC family sporulation protein [Clostridia bacterium]